MTPGLNLYANPLHPTVKSRVIFGRQPLPSQQQTASHCREGSFHDCLPAGRFQCGIICTLPIADLSVTAADIVKVPFIQPCMNNHWKACICMHCSMQIINESHLREKRDAAVREGRFLTFSSEKSTKVSAFFNIAAKK